MSRRESKRLTYQRVLLAVYALADDKGLVCAATDKAIAAAAGRNVSTIRPYLRELAEAGVIALYPCDGGGGHWPLVLLDHPEAEAAKRQIRREYILPHRRMLKDLGRI